MTRQRTRAVILLAVLLAVVGTVAAAEDILAHWLFDTKQLSGNSLQPAAGKSPLPWDGSTALSEKESPQALILDGSHCCRLSGGASRSCQRAFSVVVWIRVDAVTPWGGIVSRFRTTATLKGWLVGTHEGRFTFALATKGRMTATARSPTSTARIGSSPGSGTTLSRPTMARCSVCVWTVGRASVSEGAEWRHSLSRSVRIRDRGVSG
jgi:hypothetical protein